MHTRHVPRRERWPPPQPIDPSARASAFAVAGCLIAAGVATIVASVNELTCSVAVDPGPARSAPPSICDVVSGIGGVVAFIGAAAIAGGLAVLISLRGRRAQPGSHDGWRWGLAVVFTIGALILITRVPSATCPGSAEASLGICIEDDGGGRTPATDLVLAKAVASAIVPIMGFGVIARRTLAALAIPVTVAVWLAGIGWLLIDTVAPEVGG